ncbi:MAG: efflux RND transporter permease subunit [Spirochaetales bacterium]|nr:MAG: efflux RND transporter permease subunit [Spirochaetales bacterium]
MSVVQNTIKKPTTVIIIFALIVGLGLYLVRSLPIDMLPNIEIPIIVLSTTYTGAGPEDVEKSVTRPLEGAMLSLNGLKRVNSTSSEGSSQIIMEFEYGTDLAAAANDVRDSLDMVRGGLPTDASTPRLFKFNMSSLPILQIAVRGSGSDEQLREIAEDIIQPRLEQVDGVAITSLQGGRVKTVLVYLAQDRLEAYGITLTQVAAALGSQNLQTAGGNIQEGAMKYMLRTTGEFTGIEDIRNAVILNKPVGGGSNVLVPVLLRDIAEVREDFKKANNLVFINGEPGIYISVQKQSGTNSVDVADKVLARMEELGKTGALPADVSLITVSNTTTMTKSSISQVVSTALQGGIFCVIILFIFLRRIKSTLIVTISIPISILITLIAMYFAKISINLLSLTGIMLGVGMIVDNSIVIMENIFRYRERGAKLTVAANLGTKEMVRAITASTTTTVCVFLPLFLFRSRLGMMGLLFNDLSFTIIVALLASLFIAMFLVPVLGSKYLPIITQKQRPVRIKFLRAIDEFMDRLFIRLDNGYKRILAVALKNRLITILFVLGLFFGTLSFIPKLGLNLMPSMGEDSVNLSVTMTQGTPLDRTYETLAEFEKFINEEVNGIDNVILTAGGGGFLGVPAGNAGSINITLPPFSERIDSPDDIKRKLRSQFDNYPNAEFSFGGGRGGGFGQAGPEIQVKSEDLEKAKQTALTIAELIRANVPELTEPSVDFVEGLPEMKLFIDRQKANALGVDIASVGRELRSSVEGMTATIYRGGGEELEVFVSLREGDIGNVQDLNKIFVTSRSGAKIPLANFSKFEKDLSPVSIKRTNQSRVVRITGALAQRAAISDVQAKIQELMTRNIVMDDAVRVEFAGSFTEVNEITTELFIIIIISLALVFGVMAIQFESFKDPLIIFFTIPLMLVGVIAMYVITGESLSMFSLVGVIMLVGIVVNNGIVLVDYTNLMRSRGLSLNEACITAGGNRLRPILMTSLTTILGLVPMAFFPGESSQLWQPFGRTVIGGLFTSTLFTLFFVPVMYSLFNKKKKPRRAAGRGRQKSIAGSFP